MRRIPLSALLILAGASSAGLALATPEYPTTLDATLNVNCGQPAARCLICHTTARGGQGTAEQPFARRLRDLGLNHGHDPALLIRALTQLEALNQTLPEQDSDKDGVPDVEELRECGNPSGDDLGTGPVYGCDGAQLAPHVTPHGRRSPALGAVALGLAALLVHFGRRR